MKMIKERLLAIINSYNSDGYYKFGNIPSSKLQNAMQNYPVDPSDTPLALIDATVMGSAKVGMVIGLKGIYFKNDWTTKTDKNFLSWDTLNNSHSTIDKGSMSCILIVPGCEFNMSGASMKRELLINLLNQLVSLYDEVINEPIETAPSAITPQSVKEEVLGIESSVGQSSLYSEIVPEVIAVCLVSDGRVEDDEVELATTIIESDEFLVDKHSALESLSENIDRLSAEREKSKAIFKLKSTTILSKLSNLSNDEKERINIMLEGLLETVSESGVIETETMVDSIKRKLQ